MNKRLLSICFCLGCLLPTFAQTDAPLPADSAGEGLSRKEARALRRQRVAKRNLHYNIMGGPGYTPDFGVVLGATALMTFRTDPADTLLQRSVVPLTMAYMFKGSGVNLMVRPQLFFRGDRFRIFGTFSWKNTVENYYGVGYVTNKRTERGEATTEYSYSGFQLNPQFLFRVGESDFFVGPQFDVNYDDISSAAAGIVADASYVADGGKPGSYHKLSSGLGFVVSYDTRDVPSNAYRGLYLDVRGMAYTRAFGSDNNFYQLKLDYRQYRPMGERRVLTWTVQSNNVFGTVPLLKYALTGTPFDLRGYYMGQFRDKSAHLALAEWRQMINTDRTTWVKRMLHHVGYAVWGGAGFMGPRPMRVEGVLPNLGVGLRIEIQPRMNLRLDFGRDMVNRQNLFYLNMTEAF